jgi:hypothetical protein
MGFFYPMLDLSTTWVMDVFMQRDSANPRQTDPYPKIMMLTPTRKLG